MLLVFLWSNCRGSDVGRYHVLNDCLRSILKDNLVVWVEIDEEHNLPLDIPRVPDLLLWVAVAHLDKIVSMKDLRTCRFPSLTRVLSPVELGISIDGPCTEHSDTPDNTKIAYQLMVRIFFP